MLSVTRFRKQMVWVGAVSLVGAAAWWFVSAHPDEIFSAYSETRRWISAAGPVARIEIVKARDADPCPGVRPAGARLASNQYFPPGVLGCDERIDAFLVDWYTKALKALGEPSLWELSSKGSQARTYRFLWLRSFHDPIAVRLVINPDLTGVAFVKVSNGKGGFPDPGILVRSETHPVGKHGTTLTLTRVLEADFWALPTRGNPGGADGATWILEAVTDGKYQIVNRWSPGDADPIHVLGMTLLTDIGGVQVRRDQVY